MVLRRLASLDIGYGQDLGVRMYSAYASTKLASDLVEPARLDVSTTARELSRRQLRVSRDNSPSLLPK